MVKTRKQGGASQSDFGRSRLRLKSEEIETMVEASNESKDVDEGQVINQNEQIGFEPACAGTSPSHSKSRRRKRVK